MKLMRTTLLAGAAAATMLTVSVLPAAATPLAVNAGWVSDSVSADFAPSANSPWTFTLTQTGAFSITDAFNPGDIYTITNTVTNTVVDTTTFTSFSTFWGPSNATADSAWASSAYSHGQLILGPGSYSLTVEDIQDAGLPAGFYVRADTIPTPEPATWSILAMSLALLGFLGFQRRRSTES